MFTRVLHTVPVSGNSSASWYVVVDSFPNYNNNHINPHIPLIQQSIFHWSRISKASQTQWEIKNPWAWFTLFSSEGKTLYLWFVYKCSFSQDICDRKIVSELTPCSTTTINEALRQYSNQLMAKKKNRPAKVYKSLCDGIQGNTSLTDTYWTMSFSLSPVSPLKFLCAWVLCSEVW